MIFQFSPWKLDINVSATKKMYQENNFALDREINQKFINWYPEDLKSLFESVGVDMLRVRADEKLYDNPDEDEVLGGKICVRTIDFLLCGKILGLPEFYREIYDDEELFAGKLPEILEWVKGENNSIPFYDAGGLGIVFKHPYFRDPEKYSKWDCGYVMGSILAIKDFQDIPENINQEMM